MYTQLDSHSVGQITLVQGALVLVLSLSKPGYQHVGLFIDSLQNGGAYCSAQVL